MSLPFGGYYIDPKNIYGGDARHSVPEVFGNRLDLTWLEGKGPNYAATYTILPGEKAEDDGTVTYTYNKQGYRCDDFTNQHDGIHIVFSGCSNTEGMGSPIETVWSKTLYNELAQKNKLSGFFSLARSGHGWQKIISNFLVYIEQYGKPDYFFVLVPDVTRYWDWSDKAHQWFYVQRFMSLDESDQKKRWKTQEEKEEDFFRSVPVTLLEHKKHFIDFCAGWQLFEKYCESNNIKLLWASYNYNENYNYKNFITSKNYINLDMKDLVDYISHNTKNFKTEKHDLERRDGHLGILHHKFWHKNFIDTIKDKGWLNV